MTALLLLNSIHISSWLHGVLTNDILPFSFIVTSVALVFPITTSQGGAGILRISLNVSSHSVILSLMMFIVNDFDISPAAILMMVESIL